MVLTIKGHGSKDPAHSPMTTCLRNFNVANEFFKVSTLSYCATPIYLHYALFFKLADADKPRAITVLKRCLERTLSQCRQLCGVLEEHADGDLCFHKKRESTVELHVQWLDGAEQGVEYPSFDDLEKHRFVTHALGDNVNTWCVPSIMRHEKFGAQPTTPSQASAFKATFIRRGLVFVMHHHHYANDAMGWAGQLHQLAENCAAIWECPENPAFPSWDPACLDLSRFTVPEPSEDQRIDEPGPVPPPSPRVSRPGQLLLFHLPKSKMAELKKLARPEDRSYWISSYDAAMACIWRTLTKHRARLYNPDPNEKLVWAGAVNMRTRVHDPPVPPRIQGNIILPAVSTHSPVPPLTAEEVISSAPLSKLAWYIRQLTISLNPTTLSTTLTTMSTIPNKPALFRQYRPFGFPPLTGLTCINTDWRGTRPCDADFGFGAPRALRALSGGSRRVAVGMTIVSPARTNGGPAGEDEGCEFSVGVERELVEGLVGDKEWGRWFEFRGVAG